MKLKNLRYNKKYLSRNIGINNIRICISKYPSRIVETMFLETNNKYVPHVADNIIFRISLPDNSCRTVESNSLSLFWNFSIFCLLFIHMDNKKLHMTNSKLRSSDSAYSICFTQILLELFTFLPDTADKEIYNIFNSFSIPLI